MKFLLVLLFLYSDGVKRLVALLKSSDNDLILSVLSVLCNISTNTEVRQAISSVDDNLSEMLAKLLKSTNDEIRSKASILIADTCFIPNNQVKNKINV